MEKDPGQSVSDWAERHYSRALTFECLAYLSLDPNTSTRFWRTVWLDIHVNSPSYLKIPKYHHLLGYLLIKGMGNPRLFKIGTASERFVCYLDQVLLDQNREARNVKLSSYLGTKSGPQSITEQPNGARYLESTLDSIGWLRL